MGHVRAAPPEAREWRAIHQDAKVDTNQLLPRCMQTACRAAANQGTGDAGQPGASEGV